MINKNTNIDYNDLIIRYLSGEVTPDEIVLLENWVLENPDNKKLFNQYRLSWNLANTTKNNNEINVNKEFNKLSNKLFGSDSEIKIKPKKSSNIFLKIAASIIFIAISAYSIFYFTTKPTYKSYVAKTEIINQKLPDGSTFTLNKNSEIKITDKYAQNERRIILNGEAYFDVKHNKKIPFIVVTQNLEIKDIGTSFFVKSNKTDDNIEITVSSGIVSVINTKTGDKIILNKGDKGIFSKANQKLFKQKNNDENFLSWKTKIFNFRNKKLSKVINKLNQVYGSNIELQTPEIKNCRLTAKFENKNLEAILKILQATFDLKIEKKNKKILISGEACN